MKPRPARSLRRVTAVAIGAALALHAAPTLADATTGLWPDVSAPVMTARDPSKDAALVIGIERYDALPKVTGAADTARDWERYFLLARRVPPARVRLLTDQNATVELITSRARELADRIEPGGTLFIVFVGHGAPSAGGQKGLLVGADARASEASLAARSLEYEQLVSLVSTGAQARTVMVLDACFSGIATNGKTLLPDVQPVVATKLLATAKTTIFSAGEAGEYAGALPGSQRPALSYLLLGALRGWGDLDGDGRVTVSEAHQYAGMVLRALPATHEQHPQVATDDPDAPLESGATEKGPDLPTLRTKLDTWKPPEEKTAGGFVDVALACGDIDVLRLRDGLEVSIDGVTATGRESSTPGSRHAVVRYALTAGTHYLKLASPGCATIRTPLTVSVGETMKVYGRLAADSGFTESGPHANRDHWGVVLDLSMHGYSELREDGHGLIERRVDYGGGFGTVEIASPRDAFKGIGLSFIMPARWIELQATAKGAVGRFFAYAGTEKDGQLARMNNATVSDPAFELQGRAAAALRIPLGIFAVRPLGGGGGVIVLTGKNADDKNVAHVGPVLFAQTGFDVALGCDATLRATAEVGSPLHGVVYAGGSLGIGYAPSSRCTRERNVGLHVRSDRDR